MQSRALVLRGSFLGGALPPLQFAAVQDGFACFGVDEAEGRFALFQLPEVELDGGVGVENGLHGREHPGQLLRVAGEELGGGQAADVAVGAQVMDERPVQAPADGNVPVHVDEVRVAGEAIEQVLRRADVVLDHNICFPFGDRAGPAGHGLAAVAAQGGEEGGAAVGAEQGAALVKDLDLGAHGHAPALAPVEEQIHAMGAFLREEHAAGYRTVPPAADIFNAFRRPMSRVKVLIIGQDPDPTPGNAMGLSFSVHRGMPLPRSLNNIYKELEDDLGIAPADHGDLSCWADEGVMLLNRVLTVRESDAGSHRGKGWEEITECAIRALVARNQPLVGLLWGADARKCAPMLQPYPSVESAHPSPLSAHRGFFGSRPFSTVNSLLVQQGAEPVDWTVR